uniref:Uncharacterized protein n=1 Tax=Timema genevievae TaxID=629358 RepID=A0A7R9K6M3_TIMGE|nr:unnamed protein product [Timema genevievae]
MNTLTDHIHAILMHDPKDSRFMRPSFQFPSAGEEECMIQECLKLIHAKLSEPSVNSSTVTKCLTFAVFAHILGYKTEFSHIHAVNLAQHGSLAEKKIGWYA